MFKDPSITMDASQSSTIRGSQSTEFDENNEVASNNSSLRATEITQAEAALRSRAKKEKRTVAVQSFVEHLWQNSDSKAGVGIVAFKKKYNFARHLIFALLKGRPVIIHGQNEKYSCHFLQS